VDIFERFPELICHTTVESWRDHIFKLGNDLGYEHTLLAIFPDRNAPVEAEFAFLHSNYSLAWRSKYDKERMGHVDPTVTHCATKSTPLIWSPSIFSARRQKEMYEEACGHGIRSGVTLPIHGPNREFGILCFVSDTNLDRHFRKDAIHNIPELSCLRDFIFETSLQFMKPAVPSNEMVRLTRRELECLKWSATGKSSWDIAKILHCSESAVNFHFSNIRSKFDTSSRRQAIVKAIRLGIISPT
jgi:LuxR family transcriptional regulator, quorum-sensing system regulator LasR